jgi:hypothetical protein
MEPDERGRPPLDRAACIPPADRELLAEHLSPQILDEAENVLGHLPEAKRNELLVEFRHAAPRYRDRALFIALARVNHNTEQSAPSHSSGRQP